MFGPGGVVRGHDVRYRAVREPIGFKLRMGLIRSRSLLYAKTNYIQDLM